MDQKIIKLNANEHGLGDLCLTSWISEGSKDSPTKLIHYATGIKRKVLELLGQEVANDDKDSITTFSAYEVELRQKGSVPRVLSRARAIGITAEPKRPTALISDAAHKWAAEHHNHNKKLVLIFPQTAWTSREYPKAYYIDLAHMFYKAGYDVRVMMGRKDKQLINVPRWYYGQDWENVMALMLRASIVIGNDSGPAHIAGTLDVPTLALMGPTTQSVFQHMPSVQTIASDFHCTGCYFASPFRAACDQGCASLFHLSPDKVFEKAQSIMGDFEMALHRPTNMWVRCGLHGLQDINVVEEVISNDGYRMCFRDRGKPGCIVVDIGAHIGSFARRWHDKNPDSIIACVECCPENIPILKKNVGEFATVFQAACTYESGQLVLLNSVKNDGTATGGSVVVKSADANSYQQNLYWKDTRQLNTITLEDIMARLGVDHIDVLKLDCEGSEFSILENATCLNRIGFICGEYHGWPRFNALLKKKFADWHFGHMHSSGKLGIFHLVNPRGSIV